MPLLIFCDLLIVVGFFAGIAVLIRRVINLLVIILFIVRYFGKLGLLLHLFIHQLSHH